MSSKFPRAPQSGELAETRIAPRLPNAQAPDNALSGAFRKALGNRPIGGNDRQEGRKVSASLRDAASGPGLSARPTAARPGHIGPRSGHK